MVKPEHNLLAKEAYERLVPDFVDFDSVNVMPLVAPIPLLIVTGARDVQFTVDGVVEVDEAARLAYGKYNLEQCHDLVIQPRAYHHLSPLGENAVMAFLKRWLQ
ncbi:MAG: hypothetical protein JW843_11030 [Candidatus Aminicenantes bacterium]|nr:hypothetical protein [Candidatus Aminicenantes bacterium]